MTWIGLVTAMALLAFGCDGATTDGSGGTAGTGGAPGPPASVDRTCRNFCANEPEGFSCFDGAPELVQACYEQCLSDFQDYGSCGDEWIAIYDCYLDLECSDLFGDCESGFDPLEECVRLANNRLYCEANCPELDIAQCEQDITECREFARANEFCEVNCPMQDRADCIAQYGETQLCGTIDPGSLCSSHFTAIDRCVNPDDQAALEALATDDRSGPEIVGGIAGDCPIDTCGAEVGAVLSEGSIAACEELAGCIAECVSNRTGLSLQCTDCFGSIGACTTEFCVESCLPPNLGSPECANCALENCIDVNACTGFY